jgi:two-component system, cell cycle response regulator DivK
VRLDARGTHPFLSFAVSSKYAGSSQRLEGQRKGWLFLKRIEKPVTPPSEAQGLLLYVEDEQANHETTEIRLNKKFKLLWAKNDQEACAIVRDKGPELVAVLMDLQLKNSKLDGLALTRIFRGQRWDALPPFALGLTPVSCPIYFLTAHGSVYSEAELEAAGCDAYIPKPVDFLRLNLLLARTSMRRVMSTLKG